MRNLLLGTAIAAVTAWPVLSQQTTTEATAPTGDTTIAVIFLPDVPDPVFASELIGTRVYSSESDYSGYDDTTMVPSADRDAWDDIGEIGDVVMSAEGDARGVLVDIGGFLGLGEHTVALDMNQINLLRDEAGSRFVAVNSTREQLENAAEYERPMDEAATVAPDVPVAGLTPATPTNEVRETVRPTFEREGYVEADYDVLTAENLEAAAVFGPEDERIGEIETLTVDADGRIDQAIMDIGGFLGIGERRIALDYDELQVMMTEDASDVRVYVDQTREALEARPVYDQ